MFTRVDLKRFTETEWEKHLKKKASALKGYMEQLNREDNIVQLVIVCEDVEDFKTVSTIVSTMFPEDMFPHIYYSSEGAIKSAAYDLKNSMIRVTGIKNGGNGCKVLDSVSAQWAYPFF